MAEKTTADTQNPTAIIPFIAHHQIEWDNLAVQLEVLGKRLFINQVNWANEYPYTPLCVVDVAYSEQSLFLHYFVRGLDLRTLSAGDGNYVHVDSCVEFFMQRERGDSYINFEFNAAGVSYSTHHKDIKESTPFSPEEYASIRRKATFEGQKIERNNAIESWSISVEIPWTTMGYAKGETPSSLYANFYKCADNTAHPHFLSWGSIVEEKPAFHRPQFFGTLVLDKTQYNK